MTLSLTPRPETRSFSIVRSAFPLHLHTTEIFLVSGHSTQEPTDDEDEEDGMNECKRDTIFPTRQPFDRTSSSHRHMGQPENPGQRSEGAAGRSTASGGSAYCTSSFIHRKIQDNTECCRPYLTHAIRRRCWVRSTPNSR